MPGVIGTAAQATQGALNTLGKARGVTRKGGKLPPDNAAIVDLSALQQDFAKIAGEDAAEQMMGDVITHTALNIQRLAQLYAPKKSGQMAASIEVQFGRKNLSATIEPKADYAKYVEYGTGGRGELPGTPYVIKPVKGKALRFEIQGKVVFASQVVHPGIRPQPFMRPAALEGTANFHDQILAGAVDMIVNTPAAKKGRTRAAQRKRMVAPR